MSALKPLERQLRVIRSRLGTRLGAVELLLALHRYGEKGATLSQLGLAAGMKSSGVTLALQSLSTYTTRNGMPGRRLVSIPPGRGKRKKIRLTAAGRRFIDRLEASIA